MEDQVTNTDQDLGGGNNLGWRAGLPDEFKEHDWAKAHGNVGDFFKDALESKTNHDSLKTKMEGALFKPSENATDEERSTFYNQMGRPEKPDGYQYEDAKWPEETPELIQDAFDKDREFYRDVFHEAGITQEQAKVLTSKGLERVKSLYEAGEKAKMDYQDKVKADLAKELGDGYDKFAELATRGYKKAGELAGIQDDFIKFMEDSRLGDNPMFLKVFSAIGKAMGEDTATGIESKGLEGDTRGKEGQIDYRGSMPEFY